MPRRAGSRGATSSRRSGALVVSFGAASLPSRAGAGSVRHAAVAHRSDSELDSWIAIAADGTVTAYTGKCELGQGMFTAQTQLVAEELCVPLDRVTLIQCDTGVAPDQGTTSGSQSTPTNFNDATSRRPPRPRARRCCSWRRRDSACRSISSTVDGGVDRGRRRRVEARHLRRAASAGQKFNLQLDPQAKRKPASEWTVLGKPVPRLDMPRDGDRRSSSSCTTCACPGMLHGAVVRPPARRRDARERRRELGRSDCPGVVKVVVGRTSSASSPRSRGRRCRRRNS